MLVKGATGPNNMVSVTGVDVLFKYTNAVFLHDTKA